METIALIIFVITYTGIIFTRLPWMNVDRPSAAFFGSVAMIVFGVLTFDEAISAIDFNTIALLLGMMIIITVLELDGFFTWLAAKTVSMAKNETRLLVIIVFTTGISSAFLVNDAVVLLYTPVVISICRASKLNPVPYLIAEILAANTGSAMTITGNPQNMLIGMSSGISYLSFLLHLMPVSIIGMVMICVIMKFLYPLNFRGNRPIQPVTAIAESVNTKSMRYSGIIFAVVIVMFFLSHLLHISIPVIALIGASLVLIFGRVKPSKVIKEVDWVLILFFACLFIVVKGVEKNGLLQAVIQSWQITGDMTGIGIIHGLSLFLSQIVSNVPYTIFMIPILSGADNIIWLALASASTIAGNATIIGAMANLIVIETAEKMNVTITFREFLRPGIITTLLTLLLSMAVLWAEMRFL
jgi:Na+/H+ antiporter NhaD/arsenite permease-like protein